MTGRRGVCVNNVGINTFLLVVALFWLYMSQPGRNPLASVVRTV